MTVSKYVVVLFFLFFSSYGASDESFGCFSVKSEDVCVKTSYQEIGPIDAFSKGYWDALVDHTGAAVWDFTVSEGEALGKELALLAAGQIAMQLGAPPFVLDALGVGGTPDISNRELILEIDKLLQQQTAVLIEAMDENRIQIIADIKEVLADNCTAETDDDYSTLMRGLAEWNGYTVNLKSQTQHLNQLLNRLNDLSSIEQKFSTNDGQSRYCYWGKHVEFFAWAMRLYAVDINTRAAYHNVVNDDPVSLKQNLESDYNILVGKVGDLVWELESSQTDNELTMDETVSGDKANAWWDDVVLDTTDFVHSGSSNAKYLGDSSSTWTDILPAYVISKLNDTRGPLFFSKINWKSYDFGYYTINNIPYKFTLYVETGSHVPFSIEVPAPKPITWVSSVIVGHHFERPEDSDFPLLFGGSTEDEPFYVSEAIVGNALGKDVFHSFISSIIQYHMDLEYAQRLQMAYAPYQAFLNDVWGLIGEQRHENKMDREYLRTSGLQYLDSDGLSIAEELSIGTDPRNNDTDGDGFHDGFEYTNRSSGLDPLIWNDPGSLP